MNAHKLASGLLFPQPRDQRMAVPIVKMGLSTSITIIKTIPARGRPKGPSHPAILQSVELMISIITGTKEMKQTKCKMDTCETLCILHTKFIQILTLKDLN